MKSRPRLILLALIIVIIILVAGFYLDQTHKAVASNQPLTESVVARLYYTSQADLNALAARYDILEVNHDQGYVLVVLAPDAYASLQQAGYRLEVDEGKTKLLNQPLGALPGQGTDSIPGYPCYRTVEETYQSMQDMVANHPDMAEIIDIGDSWTRTQLGLPNGYDVLALRLSNKNFGNLNTKPTFFLMAEIHARELTTAETAMRFAEYLINNYGTNPDITWLLDYYRVYIVTMTNPDGRKIAETGTWWRKNVDNNDGCTDPNTWGTDLNRNYNFHWSGSGSSTNPCAETYRGPTAGSEPETQAIQEFLVTIFSDQRGPGDTDPAPADTTGLLITLHSYARVVLYPWGWEATPSPNATQLATLGRKYGFFNHYEVCQSDSNCMYTTNGSTDDWSYGNLGIASYTFEIGVDFFESCSSFESTTYPENLPALLYAFKASRRPYQNPAGPDSLNVTASPAAAILGEPVLLTATADDTRYNSNGQGIEPTQNIAEARYSLDSPSWITGTVTYPMQATDGIFDSKIEGIRATIDTTSLPAGRHTIFIESMDVYNNWGVPSATFLYIVEPGVSPLIEGHVLAAGTNLPIASTITAGLFNTTSNPATGYYSMTVISGTYNMVVNADNFAAAYANGVIALDRQTIEQDFHLYPICTIFSVDVEHGKQGWVPDAPWAITTEASHSPSHSWTDSPGGYYGDNLDISLTSHTFDFTDNTGISVNFWHKYWTEQDWDFAKVEYNIGSGWVSIATYDGTQNSWIQEQIQIPQLDGQPNARLRFHFTSDSNTHYDGWHIDDISINAGGPQCLPPLQPITEFTSNSPVSLGQPVIFTNRTAGAEPMVYNWNFGDGVGTSTETNPSYTYADIGTYTVTLIATNTLGMDSITHPTTVEPAAITSVDLTRVTTDTIFLSDSVDFSADLMPDIAVKPYDYTIDFGDSWVITGTSGMDPLFFFHIFSTGGSHTVKISVKNDVMGKTVTDSLEIYVNYKLFLPLTTK